MKLTTEQIAFGADEVIIRYQKMTPEIAQLIKTVQQGMPLIIGRNEAGMQRVRPGEVYYFECVDEKLFACTKSMVLQVAVTLAEAEERYGGYGFFRCNKASVVNMNKVVSVKSEIGGRIDAVLDNGEHIIISRHYARAFREILKQEGEGHA